MKSKIGWLLLLMLFGTTAVPLWAQEHAEDKSNGGVKWYQRVGNWFFGTPWAFEGEVPTNHVQHLIGYSWQGVHDGYLSPIAHKGWGGHYRMLRDYYSPQGRALHLYDELSINGGIVKNSANGSNIYQIGLEYMIGPTWRLVQYKGLTIDVGPMADLYLYGNFKLSNTNNVANAKASIGADAWGRLRYELPQPLLPVAVSYSVQLPVVHLAFHPAFGQSYYEYVSGENKKPLRFNFASFHNTLSVKQRLLIDLPIRHITLTTGVEHWHLRQKLNHTTYVSGGVSILLGISYDYTIFSGSRSRSAQIGSRYYPKQ